MRPDVVGSDGHVELVEDCLVAAGGHRRVVHLARRVSSSKRGRVRCRTVFAVPDAISLGRFLLEATRPEPGEHRSELARLRRWLEVNVDHPRAFLIREMLGTCKLYIGWAAAWARSGFQRVLLGHKLAASLMATQADEAEQMTCSPWDAYLIEVPAGLLRVNMKTGLTSFDLVGVWHPEGEALRHFIVFSRDSHAMITGKLAFPLPELVDGSQGTFTNDDQPALNRARDCMARLIISTELEMSDPARVKRPPASKRPKGDSTAPSGIHRLLREVKVDCREAISDYISGVRGTSPSVQTLVRGHFQRVAVGAGRAGRKWVQKEPYWRGPEDAPVAVRPHRLGEKK